MVEIEVFTKLPNAVKISRLKKFDCVLTDGETNHGFSCKGKVVEAFGREIRIQLTFTLSNPVLVDVSGSHLMLWTEQGEFPVTIVKGSFRG